MRISTAIVSLCLVVLFVSSGILPTVAAFGSSSAAITSSSNSAHPQSVSVPSSAAAAQQKAMLSSLADVAQAMGMGSSAGVRNSGNQSGGASPLSASASNSVPPPPASSKIIPAGSTSKTAKGSPVGTPIIGSDGKMQTAPVPGTNHQWDIIYYSQSSNDYGGSFVAQANNINGYTSCFNGCSDDLLILPLNIDFGTDPGNQVWFQFDIDFYHYCTVGFCFQGVNYYIWNNPNPTGYCGSSISYNSHNIASETGSSGTTLGYAPGDFYNWYFYFDAGNGDIVFLIVDQTKGGIPSNAFWWEEWPVPTQSLVYEGSCFSPSVALEDYADTSTTALTNVPFYEFFEGDLGPDIGGSSFIGGTGVGSFSVSNTFFSSSTGTGDGVALGIDQGFWQSYNSGKWYWQLFQAGSEVPVSIQLLADSSTAPISVSNDFTIAFTEQGCFCENTDYESTLAATGFGPLTVPTDPSSTVQLDTYSSGSGGGQWWCYYIVSGLCQPVDFSSGGGGSVSYYYYQIFLEEPFMNIIGGGAAPGATFSYTTLPSSPGGSDSPTGASVTLSTSLTVVYPLAGSTAYVPTCDPQGLHKIGLFFVAYCGTNFGALPSERWDTGIASSCNRFGLCSTSFLASSPLSIGAINYWHQLLTAVNDPTSDGTALPKTITIYGTSFGGSTSATLSSSASYLWLDPGSSWSLSPSKTTYSVSSTERYHTTSALSGTITVSGSISLLYYHQFYVVFAYSPSSSGTSPNTGWYNANTLDSITAKPANGYVFSSWSSGTPAITITSTTSKSTTMNVTGTGTVTVNFIPSVKLSVSPTSLTVAHGAKGTTTATISGAPQSVTLSYTSTATGIKATFATNPVTDSISGVTDTVTIKVASTVAPGTYHVTITATGADGQTSSVTLKIIVA